MKNAEKTRAQREPWYSDRETGNPRFPKYHLTHWNGSKRYAVMVLSWDTEKNIAKGWFIASEHDTIREARAYAAGF